MRPTETIEVSEACHRVKRPITIKIYWWFFFKVGTRLVKSTATLCCGQACTAVATQLLQSDCALQFGTTHNFWTVSWSLPPGSKDTRPIVVDWLSCLSQSGPRCVSARHGLWGANGYAVHHLALNGSDGLQRLLTPSSLILKESKIMFSF